MATTEKGGRYIVGNRVVDANNKRLEGWSVEKDSQGRMQAVEGGGKLSAEAQAYADLKAEDVVSRIESGELSADDAERLEAEAGKSRVTVANAIKAAREPQDG